MKTATAPAPVSPALAAARTWRSWSTREALL